MVVPVLLREGVVLFQPPGYEPRLRLRDDDGVAEAVPVAALVAEHRVSSTGEDGVEGFEGVDVGVEVDAACFQQDLEAEDVAHMGHVPGWVYGLEGGEIVGHEREVVGDGAVPGG